MKTDIAYPQWDTLYSFYGNDSMFVFAEPPQVWIAPNNDVILLMTIDYWSYNQLGQVTDLIAYNYTRRDTQFIVKEILPGGTGRAYGLTIHNNSAAVMGPLSVAHVDLISGEKTWERFIGGENGERFGGRPLLTNKLLIAGAGYGTYAFDLETGAKQWKNTDVYMTINNAIHKGKLLSTSSAKGGLGIVDLTTGATFMNEKSPNALKYSGVSYWDQGFSIDKEKGLIYVSDGYFIQCVKVPF